MTKVEREAIAFVQARRAELDTVVQALIRCDGHIPYEPETGDGWHSCIKEEAHQEDWCDSCIQSRAAHNELPKLRAARRNAWRRLERAVKKLEPGEGAEG